MRDVSNGWLIRYLHANTASAFFFLVYLHMGRGIYYGSYRAPRTLTWAIGTIIFIALVVTAFLGYKDSPKWFNINIYRVVVYLLIIIFIIIHNLFLKSNRLIQPSRECNALNNINSIKYNKLNNKYSFRGGRGLNNLSIRKYSTNPRRGSEGSLRESPGLVQIKVLMTATPPKQYLEDWIQ